MVVFADKNRETELIEIWQRSFGDSEEYIRMFLTWNLSRVMVIVYEVDGQAVSVAYLLPVTYVASGQKKVPCWYLYAAATLPEFRGRGYFGEIMKVVRENIPEPVILVPGEASLVAFYQKQGMHVWQKEKTLQTAYDAAKTSTWMETGDFEVRDLNTEEYALQRDRVLSESAYIKWDEHFMEYICHENKICGATQKEVSIDGSKYIVMYRTEGHELRILEMLPQTGFTEQTSLIEQKKMEMCVQVLLKETNCKKANVCMHPTVMATDKFKTQSKEGYFNLTMG